MATGLWLLAIVLVITANPALQLLTLSDRFAAATSEAQRSAAVAAGEALLAGWEGPPSRWATSWGSWRAS
jgi:hypothetical protein